MNDLIVSEVINPAMYQKFLNATVTLADLALYLNIHEDELNSPEIYPDAELWGYQQWLYMCKDECMKDEGWKDLSNQIRRDLSRNCGRNFDSRKIPKIIHRNWLDRFSFFS